MTAGSVLLSCISCSFVLGHGMEEWVRSEATVLAVHTDKVGSYVKIAPALSSDQLPPASHIYLFRLKCHRLALKLAVESAGESDVSVHRYVTGLRRRTYLGFVFMLNK